MHAFQHCFTYEIHEMANNVKIILSCGPCKRSSWNSYIDECVKCVNLCPNITEMWENLYMSLVYTKLKKRCRYLRHGWDNINTGYPNLVQNRLSNENILDISICNWVASLSVLSSQNSMVSHRSWFTLCTRQRFINQEYHKNQMIVHAQFCSTLTNVLGFIYFKLQSKSFWDVIMNILWLSFFTTGLVLLNTKLN